MGDPGRGGAGRERSRGPGRGRGRGRGPGGGAGAARSRVYTGPARRAVSPASSPEPPELPASRRLRGPRPSEPVSGCRTGWGSGGHTGARPPRGERRGDARPGAGSPLRLAGPSAPPGQVRSLPWLPSGPRGARPARPLPCGHSPVRAAESRTPRRRLGSSTGSAHVLRGADRLFWVTVAVTFVPL